MTDREKYYDNVILKVVSGVDFGFWAKLIDLIMTSDDQNYKKLTGQYKELMDAIDRYNKKNKGIVELKLQRRRQ